MNTVLTRLLQPTWLVIGLALLSLLVALAMLILAGGASDTEQLVGPFRWEPLDLSA
ncbi:MAG TPA: hypothetical protein VIF08_05755 [Candidatus Limnocylindrales bacterium]|jgi:hypothetical protein